VDLHRLLTEQAAAVEVLQAARDKASALHDEMAAELSAVQGQLEASERERAVASEAHSAAAVLLCAACGAAEAVALALSKAASGAEGLVADFAERAKVTEDEVLI
jgi:hypothetical protein